jgi:thiamine biosynthesis lipoprotein
MNMISDSIDSILINLNQQMSTWIEDSEISLFNISLSVTPYKISDDFYYVLQQGKLINDKTDGAFDYTIYPIAELWGFGPNLEKKQKSPEKSDIEQVLSYVGIDKIKLEYPFIKKLYPKMRLDLNAIAKGYAVDQVHDWLEVKGFSNIFVEIGGEIRCSGLNISKKQWIVGIDMPIKSSVPGQELYTTLQLENKALATSGSYRNYRVQDGQTINHTIDPASGFPKETNIVSVSVKSDNCLNADAWATALMVLSYEDGIEKVEQDNTIEALWIVLNNGNSFENYSSSGFFK